MAQHAAMWPSDARPGTWSEHHRGTFDGGLRGNCARGSGAESRVRSRPNRRWICARRTAADSSRGEAQRRACTTHRAIAPNLSLPGTPIGSSGERSHIFLPRNGTPGWKRFWTMKSAAIRPCSRKRQRQEYSLISGEAFQREAIIERLRSIRVPTLLLRAESGFTPGQPPLFPDALAAQIREYVPADRRSQICRHNALHDRTGRTGGDEGCRSHL